MTDTPISDPTLGTGQGEMDTPTRMTRMPRGRQGGSEDLVTEKGRTTIADAVVAKITGIAASDVSGVHALGGGASRAVGAIRERIPGASTNLAQGVSVEVGERQAAADIDVVAEFGVALPDLAADIRESVIASVERMTGLEVTEVNVTVNDVYVDTGDDQEDQESRVQ